MQEFYTRFIQASFDPTGQLTQYTYTYPPDFNYGYDVIDVLGQQAPDRLAMLWRSDQGETVRLTFGDLRRLSTKTANLFRSRGLQKGDVLTVALRIHWEYWIVAIAAHKLGLILSPLYYRLTTEDFLFRMQTAGTKALVCCPDGGAPERMGAAAEAAGVSLRFCLAERAGFEAFHPAMEAQPDTMERVKTQVMDPILVFFTSGTTSQPKAVLHDHRITLSNYCGSRYMQEVHAGSRHYASGDTGWGAVSGTKFYFQWATAATLLVYDYDRFPPEQVLAFLAETGATSVWAQPTVYRKWTDIGMMHYDLSSVSCFSVGGEKLPPDLARIVQEQTGQVLYEGYAQSEAGLIAANSKNMGRKPGSMGKILPKYHVELLKEDGTFARPGEEGEIVLVADHGHRPAGLLMGYLHDPEATRRIWDGDLFHTNDLAIRDADDFLFYRGRADGIIKTKGYRVSPAEIEDVVCLHPSVYECLAVGVPDRELGQKIQVYVCLVPGCTPSDALKQEILTFHNSQAAGFKKIRALDFVPELAHNASGKLIRGQFQVPPLPPTDAADFN